MIDVQKTSSIFFFAGKDLNAISNKWEH